MMGKVVKSLTESARSVGGNAAECGKGTAHALSRHSERNEVKSKDPEWRDLEKSAPNIAPSRPPLCTVILTPKAEKSSDIFFMLSFPPPSGNLPCIVILLQIKKRLQFFWEQMFHINARFISCP